METISKEFLSFLFHFLEVQVMTQLSENTESMNSIIKAGNELKGREG